MKKQILAFFLCLSGFYLSAQDVYYTVDTDNGCVPLTVNFLNETHLSIDTTNMIFIWSFNDGSDQDTSYHNSHTFNETGSYTVYVFADSMGTYIGGYTREIQVYGISGMFYPEDSSAFCPGEYVEFYVDDNYNSIEWNIEGSGETYYNNHFMHTFDTGGFYTVELIISHSCGTDTITQEVEIDSSAVPQPLISTNSNEVCMNDVIRFNTSIEGIGYFWDFKDGNTSSESEPEHSYSDTGTYWVSVEVTNACMNTGTDSVMVQVDTGIQVNADFHYWGESCPGSVINFSTNSAGILEWDFGNGETASDIDEFTSYADTGMYIVQLIVTNGCGTSDTATREIHIQYDTSNKPTVYIRLEDESYESIDTMIVCPGTSVEFGNNSHGGNNQFTWYFGDGDTLASNAYNIEHVYNSIGEFEVLLVGRNSCGGVDTAVKWIFVTDTLMPNPDFQILPDTLCPGEFVYFYDENSDEDNLYSIWFGDGFYILDVGPENDSIVPVTARHQYFNNGIYVYTFSTTNRCGNTVSQTDTILVSDTIGQSFVTAFSDTEDEDGRRACPGDSIEFYGLGGTSVVWDFGGGVYDSNAVAKYAYGAPGVYIANAIFTTGCGAVDTIPVPAFVGTNNLPNNSFSVEFSGSNGCAGDTVFFEYHRFGDDQNLTYLWYFGDGDSSTIENPYHVYDTNGEYEVELIVTNGCGSSYENQMITINGIYIDESSIALSNPDCGLENGSITGIGTSGSSPSRIDWYNANDDNIGSTLSVSNLSAGEYRIEVENFSGCIVMAGPYILNNTGAPIAPSADSPSPYCEGDIMSDLTVTAGSGGILKWYSDPALTDSIASGTTFNPALTETANLYVTETNGICESPATVVSIIFNQVYEIYDTIDLCSGENYFAGGALQTSEGTYYDTLTSMQGCDSFIITTIYVLPVPRSQTFISVCAGDPYFIQGEWQTEPGIYADTVLAANGCDSIIETHLSHDPVYNMNFDAFICNGDSIFLEGEWQQVSGIYTDTYVSQQGCDSTVNINLTIGDININSMVVFLCEGDSIEFAGTWYKETGIYHDTLVSGTSCDSINELNLTVSTITSTPVETSICDGDSIYLEGIWQKTAGIYYDTLASALGCDSIIVTTVSINPSYVTPLTDSICDGDSILIGGEWRKEAGVYEEILSSVDGCDSVLSITLSILYYEHFGEKNDSICDGDSILLGSMWRTTAGIYTDTIVGPLCDSIFDVTLSIIGITVTNTTDTICDGDSILLGGSWQTTEGTYYDTLSSTITGCDSVIVTELGIKYFTYFGNRAVAICNGDSILLGSLWRKTSGNFADTIAGPLCDSIFTVQLTTLDLSTSDRYDTICLGDSISIDNSWIKTAGTYSETMDDINGCDSTITVYLTVENCSIATHSLSINTWEIYPNPSTGFINVKVQTIDHNNLIIYDAVGMEIYRTQVDSDEIEIDLNGYSKGIYLIQYGNITQELVLE